MKLTKAPAKEGMNDLPQFRFLVLGLRQIFERSRKILYFYVELLREIERLVDIPTALDK